MADQNTTEQLSQDRRAPSAGSCSVQCVYVLGVISPTASRGQYTSTGVQMWNTAWFRNTVFIPRLPACSVFIRSDRSGLMWSQYYQPCESVGNNQRFLWRVFCIFSDLQTWVQVPLFHETCGPGERVRYHLAVCRVAATAVLVVVKALNGSCFCCRKLKKQTEHQTQKGFISYFFYYTEDFSQKHWLQSNTVWTQAPSLLFILHLITVAVLFLTVSMIQFKQFCRVSDH